MFVLLAASTIVLFTACERHGGRWSQEWEARFEEWQPSETVMDIFGIRPGMTVGEIGAGNGRFSVRMAQRVGLEGMVYANDIDPKALRFMRRRIQKQRIANMAVVKGKAADPCLPTGELDLVCMVNTYDELSQPVQLMKEAARSLKPGGILAIMVYDTDKAGAMHGHAVPKDVVIGQAQAAGYELKRLDTSLPYDTIYLFQYGRQDLEDETP